MVTCVLWVLFKTIYKLHHSILFNYMNLRITKSIKASVAFFYTWHKLITIPWKFLWLRHCDGYFQIMVFPSLLAYQIFWCSCLVLFFFQCLGLHASHWFTSNTVRGSKCTYTQLNALLVIPRNSDIVLIYFNVYYWMRKVREIFYVSWI